MSNNRFKGYRGKAYHCLSIDEDQWLDDAVLIFNPDIGNIEFFGEVEACNNSLLENTNLETLDESALLIPGLIDCHVHLPQLNITGCQSESLLDWLNDYIFAEEARFSDLAYAESVSEHFFKALLKNGTTTAAVFLTSHTPAAEIAFETAKMLGNRVIMGLNLMDSDASSPELKQNTQTALAETEALCKKWHGEANSRIQYAWVPRFALTSTPELLYGLGQLREKYPDVFFHTHLSEQKSEIEATLKAFLKAKNYTDVYHQNQLLRRKSILAHGVHLNQEEQDVLSTQECILAHCPESNFFLKSGRFPLKDVLNNSVYTGLGSDVGAGPDLSIFSAMKHAQYMQEDWVVPVNTLFYLATLGAAKGLMMDADIGNFKPGKKADFLILDTSMLRQRYDQNQVRRIVNPKSILSKLIYNGDDRVTQKTFVDGFCVYDKQE